MKGITDMTILTPVYSTVSFYHLHSMTKESFIKDPETSHGNPLPNLYLESTRSGDPFEAEIVLRTD